MRSAQGHVHEVKKGELYEVVVEFPRRPNGSRHQVRRRVRGSRRDAERKKVELLIEAGYDVNTELTVAQYCELVYLPAKKSVLKQSAYDTYVRRVKNHIVPDIGEIPLADLSPAHIRKWLASKEPKVAKECRRMLRMVCQEAVYDDHLRENPVDHVRPVSTERYEPEVLNAHAIAAYLKHFQGLRSEPAVLIAIGCGLRRGEVVALNVEDIDKETGRITIDNSIVPTSIGDIDQSPKTAAGIRSVHMPEPLLSRLLEILPECGPVVRKLNGSRMRAEGLTHLYEKERKGLPEGVPLISLKNLRHTSLTLVYDATGDILAAKERAGHTNISITSRYYVRPTGERDIKTAEVLSGVLGVSQVVTTEKD